MVSFPYYSQIFRDSDGSGMGIVWDTYHKEVPLLGVPENPTDLCFCMLLLCLMDTFAGVEACE